MEDEADYEVDYEVDDAEEAPPTLEVRQEPELEPEPEPVSVEEPDISAELERLEEQERKQRKASKKRPGSFWKKPPTFVYANNFGFGVNSYQSMIDYLDAKDAGHRVNKDDVHLPMLEERCMRQYEADKPFKWYENTDIDRYIDKGEKIRTQIRQNDAVGVSNVLRRTHTNWSMTRKWVQLVKNSHVVDYRKLHKKPSALDYISYRSPSPARPLFYQSLAATPVTALDYLSPRPALTPKTSLLGDLSTEFASVVQSLAQSRMAHEQVMAQRSHKMQELDEKFENTLDQIYEQMRRIGNRADHISAQRDLRPIEMSDLDPSVRNRIRRAEEMKDMMDCVNELTEMNSVRNTLRNSLRGLDKEMMNLGSRVDNMRDLQRKERKNDVCSDYEIDLLRADIAARRGMSRASSVLMDYDDEEVRPHPRYRPPTVMLPPVDRVTLRPREPLHHEDTISDVRARVINRAGEFCDRTSEQRRINSRARFVNIYKPRPDTADTELLVPPSRTEMNIDHMARSLASKGAFQRRYDIDEEIPTPLSNINTNAYRDYCEMGALSTIQQHPSISNKVRNATNRARARSTLLGY